MDMNGMKEIFNVCQEGPHCHPKLIKQLAKIYQRVDSDVFCEKLSWYLKHSMVVFNREPSVERTINFVTSFAVSLTKTGESDGDGEKEKGNKLLQFLFEFALKSDEASSKAARFRGCQLVSKLLSSLGEDAEINDDLYNKIYESMRNRLRDKAFIVRIQAVTALTRLQDPTDKNCPIINAYMFMMSCDPYSDVRRAVLQVIAPTMKTLTLIIERTRDVKNTVRKVAYSVIADKVSIKALSISQRNQLLQDGLSDRSEIVKEACQKLVKVWLRAFCDNVLELLCCLDVENSSEVCEKALTAVLSEVASPELVENFDLLNSELVIPIDQITCEKCFYWRILCQRLHKPDGTNDELMEKILPTGKAYATYLAEVYNNRPDPENVEACLKHEYMLQQLVIMIKLIDLTDEVGRTHIHRELRSMLLSDSVSSELVPHVVERLESIVTTPDVRVVEVAEIVAEIREPITTTVEQALHPEQQRKLQLKIAGVSVELNQLREELGEAVSGQKYEEAAALKAAINSKELAKEDLVDQLKPLSQHVRQEKSDPATLQKCMNIVCQLLQAKDVTQLNPTLSTIIEEMVLPGVQNEDPAVRFLAIKALGLACIISPVLACKHLVLFVQIAQIDQEQIMVTSLKAVFDLIQTYGLEHFETSSPHFTIGETNEERDNDSMAGDSQASEDSTIARSLLTIIVSRLESETSEVRTVAAEGLVKLMISGKIRSYKLLSRLFILWYNPLTEDDAYLRHCLGYFFPFYAFANRSNQELVEQSFLPTMRVLFSAPNSSPLSSINESNVADLLIHLTNTSLLVDNAKRQPVIQERTPHDTIAVQVCNEILQDPHVNGVRTLTKVLSMLHLTTDNESLGKDLRVLSDNVLEEVKDKQALTSMKKFLTAVRSMKGYTDSQESGASGEEDADKTVVPDSVSEHCDGLSVLLSSKKAPLSSRRLARQLHNTTRGSSDGNSLLSADMTLMSQDSSAAASDLMEPLFFSKRASKLNNTTALLESDSDSD